MFVFLWGLVPSLVGCKAWSYIIHVWLMQNHSPTDGQSKEDGKGTTSLGEGNDPRLRTLRGKGFYLPCTAPSIREVSGYSMFLNPCSMKCHHRNGQLRSRGNTEAETDKIHDIDSQ